MQLNLIPTLQTRTFDYIESTLKDGSTTAKNIILEGLKEKGLPEIFETQLVNRILYLWKHNDDVQVIKVLKHHKLNAIDEKAFWGADKEIRKRTLNVLALLPTAFTSLKTLYMHPGVNFSTEVLKNIMTNCSELEHLRFSAESIDFSQLKEKSFSKLRYLGLLNVTRISLNHIQFFAPELDTLLLAGPDELGGTNQPSPSVESQEHINPEDLSLFVEHRDHQTTNFSFIQKIKSLENLIITHIYYPSMDQILTFAPYLKSLALYKVRELRIRDDQTFPLIEELKLLINYNLTLSFPSFPNLKKLEFECAEARSLPKFVLKDLRWLFLKSTEKLSIESLNNFKESCHQLEHLHLFGGKINDLDFISLKFFSSNLQSLQLSYIKVTELSSLVFENLHTLNLENCTISSEEINNIHSFAPNVINLSIIGCRTLTEISNLPFSKLESLNLFVCRKIEPNQFQCLPLLGSKITTLNLMYTSINSMKYIPISVTDLNISSTEIKNLECSLPLLEKLDIRNLKIPHQQVNRLKELFPNIRKVRMQDRLPLEISLDFNDQSYANDFAKSTHQIGLSCLDNTINY